MTSTAVANAQAKILPKAWYRQFWPWFLIALPGTTVVACMFTIWLAITNPEVVLRAPAEAQTAMRPYGEVRSAYPEAAVAEAADGTGAGAERRGVSSTPE